MTVKYPSMRSELLEVLQHLSDADYQQRAWVNHDFPPGIEYDEFDNSIHLILENMAMLEQPEINIGVIVINQEELDAVQQVAFAMDHMLKKLGNQCTDAEYIADPDWAKVIESAAKALTILQKP